MKIYYTVFPVSYPEYDLEDNRIKIYKVFQGNIIEIHTEFNPSYENVERYVKDYLNREHIKYSEIILL